MPAKVDAGGFDNNNTSLARDYRSGNVHIQKNIKNCITATVTVAATNRTTIAAVALIPP